MTTSCVKQKPLRPTQKKTSLSEEMNIDMRREAMRWKMFNGYVRRFKHESVTLKSDSQAGEALQDAVSVLI